ncbi:hypothetical protein [Cupriavidus basilensis]|uniref:hypothetical protein n=1 Tax=Cupriavidus basilensis TaxID=68895 RepID=UPI0039F66A05
MAIVRAARPESNFYHLDKCISEDKRLSWGARGVLIFLLGKPNHWRVSVQNLINETSGAVPHSGRDAVYRMLKELERVGYITRQQGKSEGGLFGEMDYMVSETCIAPLTENPDAVQPLTALPLTVEPLTANPLLVKNERVVKTEKAVKNKGASAHVLPDWIDPTLWADFEAHRKEKKKPITTGSAKRIIASLEKLRDAGQDVSAVINQTISNGWTGVFAVNTNTTQGVVNTSRHNLQSMNYDAPAPGETLPF